MGSFLAVDRRRSGHRGASKEGSIPPSVLLNEAEHKRIAVHFHVWHSMEGLHVESRQVLLTEQHRSYGRMLKMTPQHCVSVYCGADVQCSEKEALRGSDTVCCMTKHTQGNEPVQVIRISRTGAETYLQHGKSRPTGCKYASSRAVYGWDMALLCTAQGFLP